MKYADIEYSKKLADLFPESEWWWVAPRKWSWCDYTDSEFRIHEQSFITHSDGKKIDHEHYPALTTDALLERLPKKLNNGALVLSWTNNVEWHVCYYNFYEDKPKEDSIILDKIPE